MADSLPRAWIEKYCITIAETYGGKIEKAPVTTKKHKVQLLDFLTYPSKEDDVIWATVSDKCYFLPVKFTKKAIAAYNSTNSVLNNQGSRITKQRQAIAFIGDFRPFLFRVPLGQNRGIDSVARLALEVGHIHVTGSAQEGLFGEPKHIEENEDLVEWVKGLRHEGGNPNFMKEAKELRDRENEALKTRPPERQTTLPKPACAVSEVDPNPNTVYAVATNYTEKARQSENGLLEKYKASWRTISRHIDNYSVVPDDAAIRLLGILRFGLDRGGNTPQTTIGNIVSRNEVNETVDVADEDPPPEPRKPDAVQQDDNIRATTPTEWAMSETNADDLADQTADDIGNVEDISRAISVPSADQSDSEVDAKLADESMDIVYETPPVSPQSSQEDLPPGDNDLHAYIKRDGVCGSPQEEINLSPDVPFPTPAQRRFGDLATPKHLKSSPVGNVLVVGSSTSQEETSRFDANNGTQVTDYDRAPVVLIPNSDTSGGGSQLPHSQSQNDGAVANTNEQISPSELSQPHPGEDKHVEGDPLKSTVIDPTNAFLAPSQSQLQLPQPVTPKSAEKIIVPKSQSDSQTQSDSMYEASQNVETKPGVNQSQPLTQAEPGRKSTRAVKKIGSSSKLSSNKDDMRLVECSPNKGKEKVVDMFIESTNLTMTSRQQSWTENKSGTSRMSKSPSKADNNNYQNRTELKQTRETPAKPSDQIEPNISRPPEINLGGSGSSPVKPKLEDQLEDDDRITHEMIKSANSKQDKTRIAYVPEDTKTEPGLDFKLEATHVHAIERESPTRAPSVKGESDILSQANKPPRNTTDSDHVSYNIHPTVHDRDAWQKPSFLRDRNTLEPSGPKALGEPIASRPTGKGVDVKRSASLSNPNREDRHLLPGQGKASSSRSKTSSSISSESAPKDIGPQMAPSKRKVDDTSPDTDHLVNKDPSSVGLAKRQRVDSTNDDASQPEVSGLPLLNGFSMDLSVYKGEDGIKWLNWRDMANVLLKVGRLRHREQEAQKPKRTGDA